MKQELIILEPYDWRYLAKSSPDIAADVSLKVSMIPDQETRSLYESILEFYLSPNEPISTKEKLDRYLKIILSEEQIKYITEYKTPDIYGMTVPRKVISPDEMRELSSKMSQDLFKRLSLECDVTFPERVDGFAEYWGTILTGKSRDELILYVNQDTCEENDLILTVEHEIIGHGYFYKRLKEINPDFIDHGALLVEGWATYIEWLNTKNEKSIFNKSLQIRLLQAKIKGDEHEIIRLLAHAQYSQDQIKNSLNNYHQSIGFSESYTIGAMLLERSCDPKTCFEFIDGLIRSGWGDQNLKNL
jgi:hypothetical protein